MKNTQVTLNCKKCGAAFKVKAYRTNTAHYCSKECWSTRDPSQPRHCLHCGVTFNSRDKRARFCSRSCSRKVLTGPNATAWKGGISLHRTRAKAKGDLAVWRKSVYARDGYTCQHCGQKARALHAHHIQSVSKHPELMLDIDNGVTLCVPCHETVHGRKLSTPAKYPKHCVDCGVATKGRGECCRSCGVKRAHRRRSSLVKAP